LYIACLTILLHGVVAPQVIKGFDKAVTGLAVGESRKVRLDPEDAYGPVQEEAVITLPPTSKVPEGLKEGDRVSKEALNLWAAAWAVILYKLQLRGQI
jgi:FKBP-type peptidyl-prolyl cis-trans isomerase 2